MMPLNVVRKTKERQLYLLDNIQELEGINIPSLIPKEARAVEVVCKPSRDNRKKYVLEIDYILSLDVKELKPKEEEKENGRTNKGNQGS